MKRVILETPFAGNIEENLAYARRCMADCLRRDETPFAFHLLYTQPLVLDDNDPAERQKGILAGFEWRHVADATVVYTDHGISKGMRAGITHAERINGHRVEYRRLSDVDPKQAPEGKRWVAGIESVKHLDDLRRTSADKALLVVDE